MKSSKPGRKSSAASIRKSPSPETSVAHQPSRCTPCTPHRLRDNTRGRLDDQTEATGKRLGPEADQAPDLPRLG